MKTVFFLMELNGIPAVGFMCNSRVCFKGGFRIVQYICARTGAAPELSNQTQTGNGRVAVQN
jgi:hypothetical protein